MFACFFFFSNLSNYCFPLCHHIVDIEIYTLKKIVCKLFVFFNFLFSNYCYCVLLSYNTLRVHDSFCYDYEVKLYQIQNLG